MGFWDKVAGTGGPTRQMSVAPPAPVTPSPYGVPYTPVPSSPPPVQQAVYSPVQAKSTRRKETCPECGSGNYFQATPSTSPHCYECGYSSRFGAAMVAAGLSSQGQGVAATPSRQVSTANNFQPHTIIGRITDLK